MTNLIDIRTDKVVLELPAPDGGVWSNRQGDGDTVVSGWGVIARIDTAAKAGAVATKPPRRRGRRRCPSCTGCCTAADHQHSGVAMPVRLQILDERIRRLRRRPGPAAVVVSTADAATGRSRHAAAAPAAAKAACRRRRFSLPSGDRPEQRVPMTRLRARIAERLRSRKSENAI